MYEGETVESLTAKFAPSIRDILSQSDVNSVSAKKVRAQLETTYGIDLRSCKDQINQVIANQFTALHKSSNSYDSNHDSYDEDVVKSEAPSKKRKSKAAPKAGTKTKKTKKTRVVDPDAPKIISAFNAPLILSEQLSSFFNVDRLARTEIIKRLWVYIKEKKLQDPADGRQIICDATLQDLFKVDRISSFQMAKAITPHVTRIPDEELKALQEQAKLDHAKFMEARRANPEAEVS